MSDLTGDRLRKTETSLQEIPIIDDEEYILLVYSLLSERYQCKTAASASEALEYIKEEEYDLVLSDITMPACSGLELLRGDHPATRATWW